MFGRSNMLPILLALNILVCSGFAPSQKSFLATPSIISKVPELHPLWAKAANKKKGNKSTSSAGGGFGAKPKAASKKDHDFSVFPQLEPQVQDTLVPSVPVLRDEAGVLPDEVYDRLNQIYRFPNFNYEAAPDMSSGGGLSFDELIGSSEPKTSSPPSSMSDRDFADLLSSATGANVETQVASKSEGSKSSSIEAISNLPPFTDFRVLHMDPLVLSIDNFFTNEECDRYVAMAKEPKHNDAAFETRSKTVGKDSAAQSQRTSTTWFHHYKNVPEFMAKASRLLGLDGIDRWEEPQVVRYRRTEKFTWHLDALSPVELKPELGGQRLATLLVYFTDLGPSEGGGTVFRDLKGDDGMLKMQPKKGSALLFFPAAGGIPNAPLDIRTLHCGEAVGAESSEDKWISQLWLRETKYTPTAPAGNQHSLARDAITEYCTKV